ncbi:MAG TPA: acyltransferase domain-containing protein, partial [Pirellulales bacterium]
MVIVGGCDTIQNSMGYLCFSTAGALSPRGKARVFDVDADGIVISEGHGAIVLKRREDAERDGDKIYAILRGVSAGSDGRSKGMTAPRLEGQIRTLKRAYETAGIDPTSVGLFEAHGTGTAVGDQTECLSLSTYLKSAGARLQSAAVGSIKSSIGHTKCAAGVVGLIKAAMALRHRVLPPTMNVEQPNQKAGFGDGPLYVNSETRPWIQAEGLRRAGISSFGFGGTNFHTILEEHPSLSDHRTPTMRRQFASELFVYGSNSIAGLVSAASQFANQLEARMASGAEVPLERIAYAHHLRQGNPNVAHRLAVIASDAPGLLKQLQSFVEGASQPASSDKKFIKGVHFTESPIGNSAPIAFLFPGQGSQFPNMLRDLAIEFREIADAFQRAERVLLPVLGQPLSELIFPPPTFSDAEATQAAERLKATRFAQPALGVCGVAVWRLLSSFGVQPSFAAGHSFGELIALCCAECIDEETLYRLAAARGRAMTFGQHGANEHGINERGEHNCIGNGHLHHDNSNSSHNGNGQKYEARQENGHSANGHFAGPQSAVDYGQMLAVSADATSVKQLLSGIDEIWLANLNARKQTVISGTQSGIALATEKLKASGVAARLLPVSAAFHSPLMKPAHQRFQADLLGTRFASPRISVFSNVTAEAYPCDEVSMRRLLADQILGEVRFVDEIQALHRDGARVFIEVGPKSVLTGLVDDILDERPHLAVSTQPSGGSGVTAFLNALGQLYSHGVSVDFDRLYADRCIEPLYVGAPATSTTHAPHIWLVNGAYSRPASDPPRDPSPKAALRIDGNGVITNSQNSDRAVQVEGTIDAPLANLSSNENTETHSLSPTDVDLIEPFRAEGYESAESAFNGEEEIDSTSNRLLELDASRMYITDSPLDLDAMDLQAYSVFQETMRRFLETQENVARLLSGGAAPHSAGTSTVPPMPTPRVQKITPAASERYIQPRVVESRIPNRSPIANGLSIPALSRSDLNASMTPITQPSAAIGGSSAI